ncbi:MAG: Mobile element protein, partial [uncultured Acidimicrobiales bacterium]
EHRPADVAGRPRHRLPPAAPGRHAPAVGRAAGDGKDPALGAGGVPAHAHRGGDRLPGRLQRPGADAPGRLPGDQDPGGVRRHDVVGEAGHLRLPGQPRVGQGQGERLPGRPARDREESPARGPGPPCRGLRPEGSLLHRRRAGRDPLPGHGRQLRRPGHRDDPARRPGPDRRDRLRPSRLHRRPAVLPPRRRRLRTAVSRHRLALAVRGLGPLPARAHHRGQSPRPAAPPRRGGRHRGGVVPHEGRPIEGRTPGAEKGL